MAPGTESRTMASMGDFGGAIEDKTGVWRSQTVRTVTLKIYGGTETMQLPLAFATTVWDAKEMIADKAGVDLWLLHIFAKTGSFPRKLRDTDQLLSTVFVKGIQSFEQPKKVWPHPIGIIGQGYNGIKFAMTYLMDNDTNIVCFDRNDIFGGYCWITGANKTSRLQTELGAFHVWWGPGCIEHGLLSYPDCGKGGWHIWPYKSEVLRHFQHAAETYGLRPYVHFRTNVSALEVVGKKNFVSPEAEDRYYKLSVTSLDEGEQSKPFTVDISILYHFPGSLTQNRIVEYPGEDIFDGEIRHGMNDDTPYEKLDGAAVAILGNGAFAIENARTVLECGGTKAYIVTRRKNLASPRMPCWFVHQAPFPTPGGFVLKMFEPMYELANFGDPWDFWSVHSNRDRTHVTIVQNSRFGIGDVTFLMVAWGLLEYVEGVLKRCSRHTLHISNGAKLEGVTVILKALGLLGDWAVDKLHNMKEMVGNFCNGDWRRFLTIDATGMNAANFTTFSTGIGTADNSLCQKWIHDYPKEYYKMEANGYSATLPRHQAEPDIEKPAYVTDVKYAMSSGIIMDSMCGKMAALRLRQMVPEYKFVMFHTSHGTDRTLEVVNEEWDRYQADWKARGIEHDYVPYPYTRELIAGWFKEWSEVMKCPISIDGVAKSTP